MATAPVNFGLIGLGPWWESQFRPAMAKLEQRVRVVAVYDSVLARAEQAARETHARVVCGVTAVADRPNVQAILWLDASWTGAATLRLLCERRKPVLMAARFELLLSELERLHAYAVTHGLTLVPALSRRCTPATHRLQELMATELGRPLRIEIHGSPAHNSQMPFATEADRLTMSLQADDDPLLEWIDWCHYVFRGTPQHATRAVDSPANNQASVRLEFAPFNPSDLTSPPRIAEVSISSDRAEEARVQCERGDARLLGAATIEWTTAAGSHSESLAAERSETEVLLDHFCRRVVGGLIPVPDLGDLCRAKISAQRSSPPPLGT